MITLKNVTMHRDREMILDGVNWDISSHGHTALLGLNGSGKTAMLQVVTGYMPPSSGEVEVLGYVRGKSDLREVRRHIGWVSSALSERIHDRDTALDVVVSGRYASIGLWEPTTDEDVALARERLAFMGCERLEDRRYAVLSQGEKQRVLIARALVSRPTLLILDEPCSGLDPAAREHFLEFVEKLGTEPDGPTLIYVTHHIEEITPVFHQVSIMKDGRIHAHGSPQEVLTHELLSSVYGLEMEVVRRGGRYWPQTATVVGATAG
ncbi:MAG: ATP-binding cassette domain-containing protein [Spirochaetes bacterium]|jgi:iron complex transport system ATP-binding protein|nr:ATP-binding cassette domain-containing protein [Spirochaetota bacterium]